MSGAPSAIEAAALRGISTADDPDRLRIQIDNARTKSPRVARAAFDRLIAIQSQTHDLAVARSCWTMIHAVEEIRRQRNGRRSPMHRLRRKIAREDEVAALEYLARHRSDGFDEVVGYGVPELLAEAIVLDHGTPPFSAEAVRCATERLEAHGLHPDALVAARRARGD